MNFFLISNMYPTSKFPGYGSFVKNVCVELTKMGISEKYSALIRGRAKSRLDKVGKYLRFYLHILINYWKKYDFIYIHFPNQAVPALLPLLTISRRRLIVNLHGEDLLYASKGYGKRLGILMEKMCRKYADAIVVPSEYFKKIVLERGIIEPSKIIVSPSGGINPNIFYPKPPIFYRLPSIHIGYVGRMEKDKGIVEFLYVCDNLRKMGQPYKATAIGYGSYYEWAENFIQKKELKTIELIRGLSQEQLGEYYRQFDLLIFSSSRTSESLGLTGIESLACGTPVIGSNIGGIATYIKSNYNGWLTPVGDTIKIAELIYEYTKLSEFDKEKMYNNAVCTGMKYYSDQVCKILYEDLLRVLNYRND